MTTKAAVTLGWLTALGMGGLALSLPSCSRKADWSVSEWHAGQPQTHIPKPSHLTLTSLGGQFHGQKIIIQQQAVAGVPIEESFQKAVWSKGALQWTKARHLEGDQLPLATAVKEELKTEEWARLQSEKIAQRLDCKWKSSLQPLLRFRSSWKLIYKRECEQKDGRLWIITFNSQGKVLHKDLAGGGFDWQRLPVSIFTRGPKSSKIERVNLAVSARPYYLFTPNVEVFSDAGFRFHDVAQIENAQPPQESFDIVQAYFYVTEALSWVANNYQFQMQHLKVRTQVGHPEKSNVAFYYKNEIRLGSGDDQIFSHIPWDPSIVIHETMHGVIEALTGLPFQGEGGSLQEALADFMTALQLNNPNMGESAYKKGNFQRSLENTMNYREKNGGLYHDSLILSGTLWRVRQLTSNETAQKLLGYLLTHLTPDAKLADAGRLMREWIVTCAGSCDNVKAVLEERGWL